MNFYHIKLFMLFFDVSFLSLCLSLTHIRSNTLSLYITLSLCRPLSTILLLILSLTHDCYLYLSSSFSLSVSFFFSFSPSRSTFFFFWLNVQYVINYSFPLTVEDYVHRIGRTGRGGATGISHTFFTDFDKVCFTSSKQFSSLVYFHLNSSQKPILSSSILYFLHSFQIISSTPLSSFFPLFLLLMTLEFLFQPFRR